MEQKQWEKYLIGISKNEYGSDKYEDHVLELYKMFVDSSHKVSERRTQVNQLTLNTGVLSLVAGIFALTGFKEFNIPILAILFISCIIGFTLSYYWQIQIKSHAQLNEGKFAVINKLETVLPFKPFLAEWIYLDKGENAKKYAKITKQEKRVPLFFRIIYSIAALIIGITAFCLLRQC